MDKDEALKIIEMHLDSSGGAKLREACSMFIPELAECDGEKVRSKLLTYFRSWRENTFFVGLPVKSIVAWLEQQLSEQKPTEWNDEDYVMQRAALEILMASPKTVASTILKESVIVWLQSLKDRLQPKQEWSEEDENRVDQICEDLKCGLINFYANKNVKGLHFDEIIESNIDWLKNKLKYLKPQNKKWKPSKKQMKDLAFVAVQNKGNMVGKTMISLYNDLTKLMEE